MARSPASRARRMLAWTTALVVVLVLGLAAAIQFSTASLTPKLALDLAGGTEIILTPEVRPGQGTVTAQTITQAIGIIRERVDSNGSTEAEVSSQGGQNIVVDLPGDIASQRNAVKLVSQSAQMRFRPVLIEGSTAPAPSASATASASPSSSPTGSAAPSTPGAAVSPSATAAPSPSKESGAAGSAAPSGTASPKASATSARSSSTDGDRIPQALLAAPSSAAPSSRSASPAATAASSAPAATTPAPSASPSVSPTSPSDLAQITPAIATAYEALDCTNPVKVGTALDDDPATPIVTCSTDGAAKYILGPVEVQGTDISGASAGLGTTSTGASTNEWVVNLTLDSKGTKAFAASSTRLYGLKAPQNEFAIELDGTVVEAPAIQSPITDGHAQISGSFTQSSATTLANQLKFGALPISFHVQTTEQISALLGSEQLHRGLLAGLIGLVLVVLYSLAQYRTLGLVTVGSLALAAVLNFLAIDLLSWYQGYRLSLAGVAGFIVSIGITADSFIVFFERVRDEVREGRSLGAAVASGWTRARRTILISDAVNFLAAAILYVLAVGNVRGFAFTLGLTTIIDLLVVFGFTHPLVELLARRHFFASGHRLSGFDAEHLGRSVYRGRLGVGSSRRVAVGAGASVAGRSPRGPDGPPGLSDADGDGGLQEQYEPSTGRLTIAERRAAQAAREAEHAVGRPVTTTASTASTGSSPAGEKEG